MLRIRESEAAVIRMIFDMIANQGYTAYELTRWLQTAKLPEGIRQLAWRSASLHVMLRNDKLVSIDAVLYGVHYQIICIRQGFPQIAVFIQDDNEVIGVHLEKKIE